MVGRKSKNHHLPQRMTARIMASGKILYYYRLRDGKSIPLGDDLNAAKIKWAELESGAVNKKTTMADIFARYEKEVLPQKGSKTQKDQGNQLKLLVAAFGHAEPNQIQPKHIRQYLDRRTAKIAANREVALFSHVFNCAREWGYTDKINPVEGVRKNKERPRDVYVEDEDFHLVLKHCTPEMADLLELAYLTGQRPGDIRKWRKSQIKDGVLQLRQDKTQKRMGLRIVGELADIINRAINRPRSACSLFIVATEKGEPLTQPMMRDRFNDARDAASAEVGYKVKWQVRDIRAKAATDSQSLLDAQSLLGHESPTTTKRVYRRGEIVKPLK